MSENTDNVLYCNTLWQSLPMTQDLLSAISFPLKQCQHSEPYGWKCNCQSNPESFFFFSVHRQKPHLDSESSTSETSGTLVKEEWASFIPVMCSRFGTKSVHKCKSAHSTHCSYQVFIWELWDRTASHLMIVIHDAIKSSSAALIRQCQSLADCINTELPLLIVDIIIFLKHHQFLSLCLHRKWCVTLRWSAC